MNVTSVQVYELINEFWQRRKQLQQYKEDDFELNGWLSRVADTYMSSSQWYIDVSFSGNVVKLRK